MPPDSPLVSSPQSTTFSHEKRTSFFSKATGAPRTTGKKRRSTGAKFDEIIPHPSIIKNGARNLVLCFDGTGDQFDDDNSNIVKLFSMLKRDDVKQQLVYYQVRPCRVPATSSRADLNTRLGWYRHIHHPRDSQSLDREAAENTGHDGRQEPQFAYHGLVLAPTNAHMY